MPDPYDDRPQGHFDALLSKLPGFDGYVKRDARRKSDQLARECVARNLVQAKTNLDSVTRGLLDQGQIDALPRFDRLRGRLDFMISKLRGAPAGFQAFFDVDELRDELLEDVYDHDLLMIAEAEQFAAFVKSVSVTGDLNALLAQLDERWREIERQVERRDELLRGDDR